MIIVKSRSEIEKMRVACQIVAGALEGLKDKVKPGVTTAELDRYAEEYIRKQGAIPAFKGYLGYPSSLCASVNEVVVHGIPSDRVLKDGEIIGLDLGALVGGFYGDAAITVPVGSISPQVRKLLQVTEESLYRGIEQAQSRATSRSRSSVRATRAVPSRRPSRSAGSCSRACR